MKKNILIATLILSNLFFAGRLLLLDTEQPSLELGLLKKTIDVGHFNSSGEKQKKIFTLPKGLTVANYNARGLDAIGQFENNRFMIVVTSDAEDLVDYGMPVEKLGPNGNYYSVEF